MFDGSRHIRRDLALGVTLVFGMALGAVLVVPGLALADDSDTSGDTMQTDARSSHSFDTLDFGMPHGPGFGHLEVHGGGTAIETTADLTGTTTDDVMAALGGGQSLAEYASGHGVSEGDLVAAIVKAQSAEIDQAVTDGDITQEHADSLKADLEGRVTALVEDTHDGFPLGGRHHGGFGPFFHDDGAVATTATLTNTTEDDVRAALADGQTLAEYAASKGVSQDVLVQAIVSTESERIDQAVTDGDITQEQADDIKANLTDRVTEQVNRTHDGAGCPGDDRKESQDTTEETQTT